MRPDTATPPASSVVESYLRELAREEAERAVRQALQDAPGPRPVFVSIPRAARVLGIGESTLRRWTSKAGVRPEPNGLYVYAQLEDLARSGGKPPPDAPPPAPTDLAAERAWRAVDSLTSGRRR